MGDTKSLLATASLTQQELLNQMSTTFKRKRMNSGKSEMNDPERPSVVTQDFIYEHEGPLEDLEEEKS